MLEDLVLTKNLATTYTFFSFQRFRDYTIRAAFKHRAQMCLKGGTRLVDKLQVLANTKELLVHFEVSRHQHVRLTIGHMTRSLNLREIT